MRLKLERMGKAYVKGPLVDHLLMDEPWRVGEIRDIEDSRGAQLVAKYPGLFKIMKVESDIVEKVKKRKKPYDDKFIKAEHEL